MNKRMNNTKKLSEMTHNELWQLFPINLTEHRDVWKQWYEEEASYLMQFPSFQDTMQINHIGSTAVRDIWAKPIIDILLEVPKNNDLYDIQSKLQKMDYLLMSENEERVSMNKGYTNEGFAERVFHLHLRYQGDHDELYFRDYLRENLGIAKKYERLKLTLWRQFKYDRDAYTESKTEFIKIYTQEAKRLYSGRYE